MLRSSLPNSLKDDIAAMVQAACAKPLLFLVGFRPPQRLPSVLPALNGLDPAGVSPIAAELRRLVDGALSGRQGRLSSAEQAKRLVAQAATVSPEAPILLSLAWSGFLREAAVQAFPVGGEPFPFALLLLRTNDWVSQVRSAAARRVDDFLEDAGIENAEKIKAIVGCAELILDTERFGRLDAATEVGLSRLISFPGVESRLRELVLKSRSDYALRILRLGLRGRTFDEVLPDLALHGRHHRVRRMALQALLNGCVTWKQSRGMQRRDLDDINDRDRFAAAGLQDRSIEVQRMALSYVVRNKASSLHEEHVIRPFLTHRSLSIVEQALFALRAMGVDVVSESREQLRSEVPSIASARILARYGDASDGETVFAVRERCTADHTAEFLAVAAQLSCASALEELRRIALEAQDLKVAREASRALSQADADIGFEALEAALSRGTDFVERGLVPFAAKLSVVRSAHLTVLLMKKGIGGDCEELWRILARRRNRGAFQPSDAEVNALFAAVGADTRVAEKVQAVLGLCFADTNIFHIS